MMKKELEERERSLRDGTVHGMKAETRRKERIYERKVPNRRKREALGTEIAEGFARDTNIG